MANYSDVDLAMANHTELIFTTQMVNDELNGTQLREFDPSLSVWCQNTRTLLSLPCNGTSCSTELGINVGAKNMISPILLAATGITGIIWALYYLYTTKRPQQSRTVFYHLLTNHMWTNLFGKIITTPVAVLVYAHASWVGGVAMCNYHGFSMLLVGLVTHCLVSAMAVERYMGIRHGYWYNKHITDFKLKVFLLCMWAFCLLFCALPLLGFGQYARQYPGTWCFMNTHLCPSSPFRHRLYTYIYGAITISCLLIIVICNGTVITTLLRIRWCQSKRSTDRFCKPHRSRKQRELEIQMVVVLAVITITFLLSFLPLDVSIFLNQYQAHTDHTRELIFIRLVSLSQILDPWTYIIMRKLFNTKAWQCCKRTMLGRGWSRRTTHSIERQSSSRKHSSSNSREEKKENSLGYQNSIKKLASPLSISSEKQHPKNDIITDNDNELCPLKNEFSDLSKCENSHIPKDENDKLFVTSTSGNILENTIFNDKHEDYSIPEENRSSNGVLLHNNEQSHNN
ncbi:unnamed protein product [Meganyctiphanes norvegica]|uniref:G-protein coupled receptors family 1 profile domain-containing protein n=1 Tax=Meganyctiphanes norvegica TaxID=48144 RepID=A0AAV2QVC2_MEGNR